MSKGSYLGGSTIMRFWPPRRREHTDEVAGSGQNDPFFQPPPRLKQLKRAEHLRREWFALPPKERTKRQQAAMASAGLDVKNIPAEKRGLFLKQAVKLGVLLPDGRPNQAYRSRKQKNK